MSRRPADDSAVTQEEHTTLCRLQQSLGREAACPEQGCPFWSSGTAERQAHCSFDGLDLGGRADLATWLLDLRDELAAQGDAERDAIRARFYRRLNAGPAD